MFFWPHWYLQTGGITIRNLFQNLENSFPSRFQSIVISKKSEWKRRKRQLHKYFLGAAPSRVIYIELHGGGDDFSYWQHQRDKLSEWRSLARTRGIPFLSLTLVRRPVEHALSHFNFYHTMSSKDRRGRAHARRFHQVNMSNEENLKEHLIPNAQCLFLTRGEAAYETRYQSTKPTLPDTECLSVFESVRDNFDWIGTTERLSFTTLPLLRTALRISNATKTETHANSNLDDNRLMWGNMSFSTQTFIKTWTTYDSKLYNHARTQESAWE